MYVEFVQIWTLKHLNRIVLSQMPFLTEMFNAIFGFIVISHNKN